MLEVLGLSPLQERIYETLLEHPGVTLAELAPLRSLDSREVGDLLVGLEAGGFVSRSASEPITFVPAPPDVAVEVLVLQQQRALEQARLRASKLAERSRERTTTEGQLLPLVELAQGADAISQRFAQLQQAATREIVAVDKPPYTRALGANLTVELECLARGIRTRVVYARAALEVPGQLELLEQLIGAGEEARVLPDVPAKFTIADERLGLLSLQIPSPRAPESVLMHPSPLLRSLGTLFELLWERATPIELGNASPGQRSEGSTRRAHLDAEIIALLSSGMKDDAIARQLGVTPRTVERHIRGLMDQYGVETRFQLGRARGSRPDG